jgi:RNA polymerase sigma-70 factor (ECF subfamily)
VLAARGVSVDDVYPAGIDTAMPDGIHLPRRRRLMTTRSPEPIPRTGVTNPRLPGRTGMDASGKAAGAVASRRAAGEGMDASSRSWVDCLQSAGARLDGCLPGLHELLLRVARHEIQRRAASLGLRGPELDDLAQQAADDALMAIKAKVADFRGESLFTTWAYRFVMLEVSTKVGRHFWRNRPAAMDDDGWDRMPDPLPVHPQERLEQREMLAELRRAILEDLTPRQRRVFVAVALNEVPMDAFARELGATRNAVYKTLFDARRKLRTSLAAAGYAPSAAGDRA